MFTMNLKVYILFFIVVGELIWMVILVYYAELASRLNSVGDYVTAEKEKDSE